MRTWLSIVVVAGLLTAAAPLLQAQESELRSTAPVRLLGPIDEHQMVTLSGTVRRNLTSDRDLGPVEDSMQTHLYIMLQRTPVQQADLEHLLARQQEPTAAEYHKWLTPKQFGARFGAHPDDIATLSHWLESHGFQTVGVMNNASTIEIAATAGQIREAFHTQLHYYNIDGGKYAANAEDPQIPASLAPVVSGIVGLVKIPPHMNRTKTIQTAYDQETHTWHPVDSSSTDTSKPDYYQGTSYLLVAPQDLYTIYNINPIFTGGDLAAKATVAVIEESDIEYGTVNSTTGVAGGGDVATFRKLFGVPGTLNMHVYHGYGSVACDDPGIDPNNNGEDGEASLDAEWINATAPSANLVFMSCDQKTHLGIFSSIQALVDNNIADTMSLSYGNSELNLASNDSIYTFLDTVESQAATQGQSIFVSSGDSGSDTKDQNTQTTATSGVNISGFASKLVTVTGGTDFQDQYDKAIANVPLSNYWSQTNSQYYEDALSYIPETTWNGSCASALRAVYYGELDYSQSLTPAQYCEAEGAANDGTVIGGSGGISTHFTVPAWQTGTSGYAGAYRSEPDISGFASNGIWHHYLLMCDSHTSGSQCTDASTFGGSGGTSYVAPYLAGVGGLLVNYTGSRQGLLNPALYALAKAQFTNSATKTACYSNGQTSNTGTTTALPASSCIFNDVTTDNNDVPCASGSTNCYVLNGASYGLLSTTGSSSLTVAYQSAPGFDQVTGLGTLNVNNLITKWSTAFKSTTALKASATTITSSQSTTLTATVTGVPPADYVDSPPAVTGSVTFKAGTTTLGNCTLSGGSCTLTVAGTSLASGANSITGIFSGSKTYPASTSSVLTVTVSSGSGQTPTSLTSPTAGSVFAGPSVTFKWALASGANGYFLHLGATGAGSMNLLNSAEYSSTTSSVTINGLPVNGETIYARLFTDYNGTHVHNDYVFTASKQAALTSPAASATLAGPSVTFDWSAATGSSVKGYFLHLGSTGAGSYNLLNSAEYSTSTTTVSISGLPLNGETIYARVFTDYNGTHLYQDYTFTAAKQAALTTPKPGSTLAGATVTFDWSTATGSNVKGYFLHMGTTGVGSMNLLNSAEYSTSTKSATVNNLPVNGATIYARMFTDYNGTHAYIDYTYIAK